MGVDEKETPITRFFCGLLESTFCTIAKYKYAKPTNIDMMLQKYTKKKEKIV